MKHLLLIPCLFLFSSTLSLAQKVAIGPEIGLNIVPLGTSEVQGNYSLAFNQGIKVRIMLKENLSFSTGLYVDQRMQRFDSSRTLPITEVSPILASFLTEDNLDIEGLNFDANQSVKGKIISLYTRIPMLMHYHVEKMHFTFGGYYSYMVSSRTNTETTTNIPVLQAIDLGELLGGGEIGNLATALFPAANSTEEASFKSTDGLRKGDYGLTAGWGYTEEKVGFNMTYSYGLTDYRLDRGAEAFKNNSAITISFSYLIDIRQKSK